MNSRRIFLQSLATAALASSFSPPLFASSELHRLVRKPNKAVKYDLTEEKLDQVVDFLASRINAGDIPGAALIVSRHGKTVLTACLGTYCSPTRRDQPLTPNTLHTFFSYSKFVSSTVMAIAVQEKLIDYNAPAVQYIPEFKGGGKEAITIRHLLTHSAGIPAVPIKGVGNDDKWAAAIHALCEAKTDWPPGSRSQYHGLTGQIVVAEAIRRASGRRSWTDICSEKLFKPIGAHSLTFDQPSNEYTALTPQPKTLPSRYGSHEDNIDGHPAGSCCGTMADAIKPLELHLAGGKWNGKTILQPEVFHAMHTVQYKAEMQAAIDAGKTPAHQSWGMGPLLRGPFKADGGHAWFGFQNQANPGIFGHAGIDTVIGVGDPKTGIALFLATTDSPKSKDKATEIRNGTTDRVLAAAL